MTGIKKPSRNKGGINRNYKLKEKDVLEIVDMYKNKKLTIVKIAKHFNVSDSTINNVLNGKNHSKITNLSRLLPKKTDKKLNKEIVLKILELRNVLKYKQEKIASELNIRRTMVSAVLVGRAWSNVTGITKPIKPSPTLAPISTPSLGLLGP